MSTQAFYCQSPFLFIFGTAPLLVEEENDENGPSLTLRHHILVLQPYLVLVHVAASGPRFVPGN